MADFQPAYDFLLGQEGGYAEDPTPTNHGITQETAAAYGYTDDMHNIPLDLVQSIYQNGFWDAWNLDQITNQGVATAILSIQANMGPGNAAGVIQKALAALGWTGAQDGAWGPETLAGCNSVDPAQLCEAISASAAVYYNSLAASDPGQYGQWLQGWLNRAAALADLALSNPVTSAGLLLIFGVGILALKLSMDKGRR